MKVDLLSVIITIAGLFFLLFCFLLIIFGKKVSDDGKSMQKIKIKDMVEVSTNSLLMLILFMVLLAIAPLFFKYWKPDLGNYLSKEDVTRDYISRADLSLEIYGSVMLDDHDFGDNVSIQVIRRRTDINDTIRYETGQMGDFLVKIPEISPEEKYTVIWSKQGYNSRKLILGFNQIPYPLVLNKNFDQ